MTTRTARRLLVAAAALTVGHSSIASAQSIVPFGTFGSSPEATFGGTGIPNDRTMRTELDGLTLILAATPRYAPDLNAVSDNGAGRYFALPGINQPPGSSIPGARWNFSFAALGDGFSLFNYKLFYDFDPGVGTDIGAHGVISVLGDPQCQQSSLQGSQNLAFSFLATGSSILAPCIDVIAPTSGSFNANAGGEYTFALVAYDANGGEAGRVAMAVNVASVPEPSSAALAVAGLLGLGAAARRRRLA